MKMDYQKIRSTVLLWPPIHKWYHFIVGQLTDVYIISFPKSGRTWVRMMLAKTISDAYRKKLNLDLYKMSLFNTNIPNINTDPRIGNYSNDRNTDVKITNAQRRKKIILLVRDPRDVLVSYFFEWTKRRENKYTGTLSEFIREDFTLRRLIRFMNEWMDEKNRRNDNVLLVKYEEIHKSPGVQLKRMLDFAGIKTSENMISNAVDYSTFDNMSKIEKEGAFSGDHRLTATDTQDRNSFKMRKGKVGGYKENLSKEDIGYINSELKGHLNLQFGY